MNDQITGISVLQPVSEHAGLYLMFFIAQGASSRSQSHVYFEDATKPYIQQPNSPARPQHIWQFRRNGSRLDCSPSVRMLGEDGKPDIFHNTAQWSVEYVEMAKPRPTGDDYDDTDRTLFGHTIHYDLNWTRTEPAGQQALIAELRAKGVLK